MSIHILIILLFITFLHFLYWHHYKYSLWSNHEEFFPNTQHNINLKGISGSSLGAIGSGPAAAAAVHYAKLVRPNTRHHAKPLDLENTRHHRQHAKPLDLENTRHNRQHAKPLDLENTRQYAIWSHLANHCQYATGIWSHLANHCQHIDAKPLGPLCITMV